MSIFHRFTGKPVDSTRLYYYGERFYGPGTVWKSLSQIYGRDAKLGQDYFFKMQRQTTAKLWEALTLKRWAGIAD